MPSDRKLRSDTRKDYKKMACVNDTDEETSQSGSVRKNKEYSTDDGENGCHDGNGEIINNELFMHEDELVNNSGNEGSSSYESAEGDISSDEELREATERLKLVKKQHQKYSKEEKLRKIANETAKFEKSLNELKKAKKSSKRSSGGKSQPTIGSLRKMDYVVEKVDSLMDRKLKVKAGDSSSSSSSESEFSSSSSSDGEEKYSRKKKSSKDKDKRSNKHRSGKRKTLTSYVKYPQKWPHTYLSLHFVNREKKYENLTLAEFCAGYTTILERCSGATRMHRTAHFRELMYLATKFQWRNVLNYHAACLLEIERGHLSWGDSFQILQSTTLAGGYIQASQNPVNRNGSSTSGQNRSGSGNAPGTVFCKGYQRGVCQQPGDHMGQFFGESKLLRHICAKCWLEMKTIASHPENSDSCPLKET